MLKYKKGCDDMFFKKKKEKEVIISKYQMGELVNFKYKNDIRFGRVYKISKVNEEVIYSIQIGGECPAIIDNIPEKSLFR